MTDTKLLKKYIGKELIFSGLASDGTLVRRARGTLREIGETTFVIDFLSKKRNLVRLSIPIAEIYRVRDVRTTIEELVAETPAVVWYNRDLLEQRKKEVARLNAHGNFLRDIGYGIIIVGIALWIWTLPSFVAKIGIAPTTIDLLELLGILAAVFIIIYLPLLFIDLIPNLIAKRLDRHLLENYELNDPMVQNDGR